MAKVLSYVNAFTGGEIGEDAEERTDLQQHAKGCSAGLNLIALKTGPLVSRGGFRDSGQAKANDKPARIVGFTRSTGDALFLEFGETVMRVRTPDGALVLLSGSPYELTTPWTAAQVRRLWFRTINDVLYVTSLDNLPTVVLIHQAANNWAWSGFAFTDGPWLGEDPTGATLTLSGGNTATASSARFAATDIGSSLQFREGDGNPGLETWTSGTDYTGGQQVQFDGRVYQRTANGPTKSGTTPPLHQSGTVSDGKLSWIFQHDGRGVLNITGYTSPTVVTYSVVRAGPPVTTTAYWSLHAYSDTQGYPGALSAERDERLIMASSKARPGIVDMTRSFGFGKNFGDFKPGLGTGRVVDDDAVRLDVGGTDRVVWLMSGPILIAGCTDREYALSGSTLDEGVSPASRQARPISEFGNADVAPLLLHGPPIGILHVISGRKGLRELRVAPDLSVESRDRSILPHHIHDRGIAELAFQKGDDLVWQRLDDGGLAVLTYHMEQEVYATTRQPLPGNGTAGGWTVESVATVRATGGDRVMISVVRTKAGSPQRRIWTLTRRSEGVFIDGALTYAGAPATVISGLDHLNGETVAILADGARVVDKVVAGGSITLPLAASNVIVGQKMLRRFESLPLDMEGVGSTNATTLVPTHATVVLKCVDALVGTDAADSAERVQTRDPDDLTAPTAKKVRRRVGLGGGSGRDRRIVIETDEPFDLQIKAYRLEAERTA